MRFRAIILLALMIGGAYVMFQSLQDYEKKEFTDILHSMDAPFNSLIFTKPSSDGQGTDSWVVDEQEEIDTLLKFLRNYHVRKLKADQINVFDNVNHFSISLQDDNGRELSIMLSEDLIIQDSVLYYEVVDGPLDIDWLLAFFISNEES